MLPAVIKLCCGISYPHLRSMTGLQRTAMAAIGQEIAYLQRGGRIQLPEWMGHIGCRNESRREEVRSVSSGDLLYIRQGQEALSKALEIAEDKDGWKMEITEENGDVICSKVLPGAKKVFRLEAVLNATPKELHTILFEKVEEMHRWNPSIQHIKVLKHVNAETMVTHEVSAATASNLIGQRDFLSVRHCYKKNSRIYLGGVATDIESHPPQKNIVRAQDGPTCIIIEPLSDDTRRSRFIWLLNMDIKGWLPKSIVNQALPRAQVDFTRHLRRRLTESPVHG